MRQWDTFGLDCSNDDPRFESSLWNTIIQLVGNKHVSMVSGNGGEGTLSNTTSTPTTLPHPASITVSLDAYSSFNMQASITLRTPDDRKQLWQICRDTALHMMTGSHVLCNNRSYLFDVPTGYKIQSSVDIRWLSGTGDVKESFRKLKPMLKAEDLLWCWRNWPDPFHSKSDVHLARFMCAVNLMHVSLARGKIRLWMPPTHRILVLFRLLLSGELMSLSRPMIPPMALVIYGCANLKCNSTGSKLVREKIPCLTMDPTWKWPCYGIAIGLPGMSTCIKDSPYEQKGLPALDKYSTIVFIYIHIRKSMMLYTDASYIDAMVQIGYQLIVGAFRDSKNHTTVHAPHDGWLMEPAATDAVYRHHSSIHYTMLMRLTSTARNIFNVLKHGMHVDEIDISDSIKHASTVSRGIAAIISESKGGAFADVVYNPNKTSSIKSYRVLTHMEARTRLIEHGHFSLYQYLGKSKLTAEMIHIEIIDSEILDLSSYQSLPSSTRLAQYFAKDISKPCVMCIMTFDSWYRIIHQEWNKFLQRKESTYIPMHSIESYELFGNIPWLIQFCLARIPSYDAFVFKTIRYHVCSSTKEELNSFASEVINVLIRCCSRNWPVRTPKRSQVFRQMFVYYPDRYDAKTHKLHFHEVIETKLLDASTMRELSNETPLVEVPLIRMYLYAVDELIGNCRDVDEGVYIDRVNILHRLCQSLGWINDDTFTANPEQLIDEIQLGVYSYTQGVAQVRGASRHQWQFSIDVTQPQIILSVAQFFCDVWSKFVTCPSNTEWPLNRKQWISALSEYGSLPDLVRLFAAHKFPLARVVPSGTHVYHDSGIPIYDWRSPNRLEWTKSAASFVNGVIHPISVLDVPSPEEWCSGYNSRLDPTTDASDDTVITTAAAAVATAAPSTITHRPAPPPASETKGMSSDKKVMVSTDASKQIPKKRKYHKAGNVIKTTTTTITTTSSSSSSSSSGNRDDDDYSRLIFNGEPDMQYRGSSKRQC
jgi:hypothetical protein